MSAVSEHPVDCEGGWIPCWAGCDDGYFYGHEEDPLWYDEDDLIVCSECKGAGGWACSVCALTDPPDRSAPGEGT